MAEDGDKEHDARKRSERHDQAAQQAQPLQALLAPGFGPGELARSAALLGDPRLNGRGNQAVKNTVMQRMQQTMGNRAVQRRLNGNGPRPR